MGGSSSGRDIFDVRKIRSLVELMQEHDLGEMDLRQGDMRIQLRRDKADVTTIVQPAMPPPPTLPAAPVAANPSSSAEAPSKEEKDENFALITSPMIGTYYSAPDPDATPYVKSGDRVDRDTTVCIIEAMKVFNEIQAEVSGKVVAALVESGEPVEFGQPLFKVDTSQ